MREDVQIMQYLWISAQNFTRHAVRKVMARCIHRPVYLAISRSGRKK